MISHDMTLVTEQECHKYKTRNKDKLGPLKVRCNWGKQRRCYQAANDFNGLSNDIKDSGDIE